jgi:hypothetical protein
MCAVAGPEGEPPLLSPADVIPAGNGHVAASSRTCLCRCGMRCACSQHAEGMAVNRVAMVCRVRMVAAHGLPVHARPHPRCASVRVIVGIAHRCPLCPQPRRRAFCSFRRHGKQPGVPTRLFASHNRGGVQELGAHRRQVVRWQCESRVRSARLFLAQRRRRHLPEHKR